MTGGVLSGLILGMFVTMQSEQVVLGTVYFESGQSRTPANDVVVTFSGPSGRLQARTVKGAYELRGLSSCKWRLEAFAPGYCQSMEITMSFPADLPPPIILKPCETGGPRLTVENSNRIDSARFFVSPDGQEVAYIFDTSYSIQYASGRSSYKFDFQKKIIDFVFGPKRYFYAFILESFVSVVRGAGVTTVNLRPGSKVTTVAFDSTGTLIATGGEDNVVRIWNVNTGMELTRLALNDDIAKVAFFNEDRFLIVETSKDAIYTLRVER